MEIKRKEKDLARMILFMFSDQATLPTIVNIKQHGLDFEGAAPTRKHLTGVYGTSSLDSSLYIAQTWADSNKKQLFLIDVWAHVPNFHFSREQVTRELLQRCHWVHPERLSKALRDEFMLKAQKWLRRRFSDLEVAKALNMSFSQLLLNYPEFARTLLDDEEDMHMLVHPVRANFDTTKERIPFFAATFHLDRLNIVKAEVRYMPGIKVKF